MLLLGGLAGQGADHVVGLEALGFDNGNAQGFESAADVGNLAAQILGHRASVGLVALVAGIFEALRLGVPLAQRGQLARPPVAEDLSADVEDGGKVARVEILAQLFDHVHKNVDGRRGQPRACAHGARTLHRVVGAKDERHGVEQEYGRLGLIGHVTEFNRGKKEP